MAKVTTYLNFMGKTEEAFKFYKKVFGTQFIGDMLKMKDMPPQPGSPPLPESEKNLVMHVALPTLGEHELHGSDVPASMGIKLVTGNNVSIMLHTDTKADADRFFKALSEGGKVSMPMAEQFWGDYYGNFTDRFGIEWMVNCAKK